jgi:diacylglycerol O-acyltransferase-1
MWNLPVHYWFIRHLYNPLLKKGYSKSAANLTVFLISAVAHEYLVSVPLGVISFYAFLAMILQSPIIYLEKKLNKALKIDTSQLGNVSFWISYCILGQPICVSIYYYLYVTKGTR